MRLTVVGLILFFAIAGCGEPSGVSEAGGSAAAHTSTTTSTQPQAAGAAATTATTESPLSQTPFTHASATTLEPELLMACGAAIAPYAPTPPTAGALDDDANSALEVLASDAEGAWFAQRFDWGLWEKSDDLLILLGSADPAVGERVGEFGSVAFERHNEGWVPSGWGTCRWLSLAEGYGPAEWTIDPANPPTPDSSSISVLATEHACAGGKVPEGREVIPLLEASSKGITIVILVERIAGAVTCPSNPPFRLTIDIGVPMGQRALYDGHAIPPILRLER